MLKLVLGASGSGKTTLLYARIRARAEAGKRSILLVPEQFTSSTEARIYRELGDALSGMVESYSFTSLAEHILAALGGAAVQTLTDAGRAVLVRRALEELQDNVHYYYRHRRSAAFCQMAAETIDELKSAGLSGQQLQELARDCGTESAKILVWEFLLVELVHPLRQLIHIESTGDELARFIIKPVSAIGVMARRENGCSVFQGYTNHLRAVVGSQTEFITDGGYPQVARRHLASLAV